jgi:hypothetical protein
MPEDEFNTWLAQEAARQGVAGKTT